MNWALLIGVAHRIGWDPDRFWRATMFELTTTIDAHIEMLTPRRPKMSDQDLAAFLRAQPGHRKIRKPAGDRRQA